MLVYATASDLATWRGTTVDQLLAGKDALLRSASILVAHAVQDDLYATGTAATDPKRDATCAQASAWIDAGITPSTAGLPGSADGRLIASKTVEGASITYDNALTSSAAALAARQKLATALTEEATEILRTAGVLWQPVPQWDATPAAGGYVDELNRIAHPGREYLDPRLADSWWWS